MHTSVDINASCMVGTGLAAVWMKLGTIMKPRTSVTILHGSKPHVNPSLEVAHCAKGLIIDRFSQIHDWA